MYHAEPIVVTSHNRKLLLTFLWFYLVVFSACLSAGKVSVYIDGTLTDFQMCFFKRKASGKLVNTATAVERSPASKYFEKWPQDIREYLLQFFNAQQEMDVQIKKNNVFLGSELIMASRQAIKALNQADQYSGDFIIERFFDLPGKMIFDDGRGYISCYRGSYKCEYLSIPQHADPVNYLTRDRGRKRYVRMTIEFKVYRKSDFEQGVLETTPAPLSQVNLIGTVKGERIKVIGIHLCHLNPTTLSEFFSSIQTASKKIATTADDCPLLGIRSHFENAEMIYCNHGYRIDTKLKSTCRFATYSLCFIGCACAGSLIINGPQPLGTEIPVFCANLTSCGIFLANCTYARHTAKRNLALKTVNQWLVQKGEERVAAPCAQMMGRF